MEAGRYILKRIIKARNTTQALAIIKTKYPKARIITYQFKKKFYEMPKEERNYKNRHMWVWFIRDVDVMKTEVW